MKTLVLGASVNPARYSYKAIEALREHGHEVIAFGLKAGQVKDVSIVTEWDSTWQVDTVTLYVGPQNQENSYQKIMNLNPRRVIFNPGTENDEFEALLRQSGIQCEIACTLVLLSIGNY